MAVTEPQAVMPQAVITHEMIAAMAAKAGSVLRIDHSVNNELASRIAVAKFAGGIADISTEAVDQRGHAVIALPSRDAGASPAARKARKP